MNQNPRLTKKDLALIKGALRRAFARSELHHKVLNAANVQHTDLSRPKVKGWRRCAACHKPFPKSYAKVDHITPVIPLDKSYYDFSVQEIVNLLWSEEANLQVLDPECHDKKTKAENVERRKYKKAQKEANK